MCDLFGMFGGEAPPSVTLAPPLASYPSVNDARFARQAGFGYGQPVEPMLDLMNVISSAGEPVSVDGRTTEEVTSPSRETFALPSDEGTDDDILRAALAANRSPVAGLGFDPRRAAADIVSQGLNTGGVYSPQRDLIFYARNVDGEPPSNSLVHEATHRGIKMLQDSPNRLPDLHKWDEELLVRQLMKQNAGDPERGDVANRYKDRAKLFWEDTWQGRDLIAALEQAASREIARRKPGGPR